MLAEDATGVATYARGLRAAQAMIGEALVLTDRFAGQMAAPRFARERWRRWIETRFPLKVRANRSADTLMARDIFRRAQVHFDRHGTLLEVIGDAGPPGVMHWTYPVPILLRGWRNAYTIHDVIPLSHSHLSPIDPTRHRALIQAIGKRGDAIVTVSQAARAAIMDAMPSFDPVRIHDAGQAVLPRRSVGSLPHGLSPRGYYLFYGSIEPRKNVVALVAAWHRSGVSAPLVIAGGDGWRAEDIAPDLIAPGILRLPYLPAEDLATLQANARAFLFPSLAEGFGLPIIEAMAAGVPVMTSAIAATTEVAGGAALLVDPTDQHAIMRGIRILDADPALRANLSDLGRTRATNFTLTRFAGRLAGVYRTMLVNDGMATYREAERRYEKG